MPATWNPTPITVMANQRQKNIEIEMSPGVHSETCSVNGSSDRRVLQRFFLQTRHLCFVMYMLRPKPCPVFQSIWCCPSLHG